MFTNLANELGHHPGKEAEASHGRLGARRRFAGLRHLPSGRPARPEVPWKRRRKHVGKPGKSPQKNHGKPGKSQKKTWKTREIKRKNGKKSWNMEHVPEKPSKIQRNLGF